MKNKRGMGKIKIIDPDKEIAPEVKPRPNFYIMVKKEERPSHNL